MTLRVLVCGGRDFEDQRLLIRTLDALHRERGIGVVINGGAPGTDTLAKNWALMRGIDVQTYAANWAEHGRAAGPKRNQQMLDEGKPDLVVAFAGGIGTADMVRRARTAGVVVAEAT